MKKRQPTEDDLRIGNYSDYGVAIYAGPSDEYPVETFPYNLSPYFIKQRLFEIKWAFRAVRSLKGKNPRKL